MRAARYWLRERAGRSFLWAFCGVVFFLLVLPIFVTVPLSFSSAPYLVFPPPGFSLQWYEKYLGDSQWIDATILSLKIGLGVTLLSTVAGTLAVFALQECRPRIRKALTAFLISPMIVPVIIFAIAIYFLYSRMKVVGSVTGMVLAHTVLAIPYVVITVTAAFDAVDRNLPLAARTLGATRLQAFWHVTLPLIRPGMIAGALFAFITSFDEVVVPIFIGGSTAITLPKRMWDGVNNEIDPTISAVSTLAIALSAIVLTAAMLVVRRTKKKAPAL